MTTIFMIGGQIIFPCVKVHVVPLLLKSVEELETMAPFEATLSFTE